MQIGLNREGLEPLLAAAGFRFARYDGEHFGRPGRHPFRLAYLCRPRRRAGRLAYLCRPARGEGRSGGAVR